MTSLSVKGNCTEIYFDGKDEPGMWLGDCTSNNSISSIAQAAAFVKNESPEQYQKATQKKLKTYDGFMPIAFQEKDNSWALLNEFGVKVSKFNIHNEQHEIFHQITTYGSLVLSRYFSQVAGPVFGAFKGYDKIWETQLKSEQKKIDKLVENLTLSWTLTQADKQALINMSPKEQADAFNSFLGNVNNPVWQSVQDAPHLSAKAKQMFAETFTKNFNIFKDILGTQTVPDKELQKNLLEAAQAVQKIQEMPQEWLGDLEGLHSLITETSQELKAINKHLNSIDMNTLEGKRILRFMADMQYPKLSTAEKIEGLKRGIYPEKMGELDTLVLLKKWEGMQKTVNDISNGFLTAAQITRQLGIKLPSDFEKGIVAGHAVFEIVMGFGTGNPLQIIQGIGSIAGLFGGGGPNISAQRHQQLVDMLKVIHHDNQVIMSMLASLQTSISQLFELTLAIGKGMEEMAKIMLDQHYEVMLKLHYMHTDILYQHEILQKNLLTYLDQFGELNSALNDSENYYQWKRGVFKTHRLAQEFFFHNINTYNQAMNKAEINFRLTDAKPDPVLRFKILYSEGDTHPISGNHLDFYENIWKSSLRYYQKLTGPQKPDLSYFFEPIIHADQLASLLLTPIEMEAPEAMSIHETCSKFLHHLVAPTVILRTGTAALEFHRFDPLIKNQHTGELFTVKELLTSNALPPPCRRGKRILERVLHFTSLSIVQHHILSGGPMIPGIDRDFFDQLGKNIEQLNEIYHQIGELLSLNPIIVKNSLLFTLRKRLGMNVSAEQNTEKCFRYRQAYNYLNDSSQLTQLFPNWKFRPMKDENDLPGWQLIVSYQPSPNQQKELMLQMIHPSELFHGKLDYPIDLYRLIDLRTQLITELVNYEMVNSVKDKMNLKQTLLENIFYSV